MKTLTTLIIMFVCVSLSAQTNYYTETKTFQKGGYVYQCDIDGAHVTIYNKNNKLTYVDVVNKDTGKPLSMDDDGDYIEKDTWTKSKCFSIVNNAFSAEEAKRVKGYNLMMSLYINSETGKVDEVKFNFVTFIPFVTIPISVFRNIEIGLKKDIWFTPTSEGKRLNYIYLGWDQEITEP